MNPTPGTLDKVHKDAPDAGSAVPSFDQSWRGQCAKAFSRYSPTVFRSSLASALMWQEQVSVVRLSLQRCGVERCLPLFLNKTDCVGVRAASRAFATCIAQVSPAMVGQKFLFGEAIKIGRHEAVEMFDPVSNTWETLPSLADNRDGAASVLINGRMHVCGGRSGSLDCFDPVSGLWQTLPPMSQGRFGHAAAVVGGRLHVCGGWDSDRHTLESAECFDT